MSPTDQLTTRRQLISGTSILAALAAAGPAVMPAEASAGSSSIEAAYADYVRLERFAELTSDARASQLAEEAAEDQLDLVLGMTATTLRDIAFQALAAEDKHEDDARFKVVQRLWALAGVKPHYDLQQDAA